MKKSKSSPEINFRTSPSIEEINNFFDNRFPSRCIERVLFVNPPDGESGLFRIATAKRRRYPNYPPYGPAVLAQQLRQEGLDTRVLNLNDHILKISRKSKKGDFSFDDAWEKRLKQELEDYKPDIVGVTCMFTMTHLSFRRVCDFVSKMDFPLIIGGVHVTNDIERVLEDVPCADAAFLRESDIAVKNFCFVASRKLEPADLSQVILNHRGQWLRMDKETQPLPSDMDVVPAYDLIDVGSLSENGVMGNFHGFKPVETKFATVLSNRGCRAQCTFCSVRNFNGKTVRQRSISSVIDEIEILKNEHDIGHIVWLDDDLLKDHDRAIALFNGIVKRKLDITWDATNGVIAASCNEEMVHAMAESGCIALMIGMESGNPQILKQIKKPGKVETFLRAAEVFHKFPQIHARVFLMIGFPGETLEMINDTINVARKMDLDWNSITPLQPLPNTPIYDSMVEQGLVSAVKDSEVRFQAGGYGKQDEIDQGLRLASASFEEAFYSIKMTDIPTREQINDIWFFMNYHLNFHRLFSENREEKIKQLFLHLRALSDVISPEHGLALYFTGYLQHKLYGKTDPKLIDRLERKLEESNYWRSRLSSFGLKVDDLRYEDFINKEIPRILPGLIPKDDRLLSEIPL
ncbi:MAG: radical SAM protein [Pseudomonadota bacterium]|nr:radical SAM protein [Pseudomonadota bacterium]